MHGLWIDISIKVTELIIGAGYSTFVIIANFAQVLCDFKEVYGKVHLIHIAAVHRSLIFVYHLLICKYHPQNHEMAMAMWMTVKLLVDY